MPRIVSLIPSGTEIVCALGLESSLAGRSHECDFPLNITSLPVCTAPAFPPEGASLEIDGRVKDLLRQGLSIYEVLEAPLKRLRPEIIITQAQCEVCAVSLKEVKDAVCRFLSERPAIVSLSPNRLSDVWEDIHLVASALEIPETGAALVTSLKERLQTIADKTRCKKGRPGVVCIEWMEPLMAAGNWVPELVELAGGQNLLGEPGHHSPWMSWETLEKANPEVIVILPCGFSIERTRQEMHLLTTHPAWPELQAVRNGQVYLTDGNQYFNRPGPRLVESAEILAEIMHPEIFNPSHRGKGWQLLYA